MEDNREVNTKQQNMTDKTIKGLHSQTLIVAIKAVLSLVYFASMSRLLTPDDFGYFALITAVTTILNSLSEAGLGSSVIQKKDASKDFASTAFTLSLILGLFFSVILFVFSNLFSQLVCGTNTLSLAFKIMSSIIFIQAANNITWALYMRKLDFFKFGILQVSADLLSYIIGISFAWNRFGFYSIVAATVSNQLFLTTILFILKKYQFRLIIVKSYIKEIIGYGGWLTASVIVRNFTNEIDKVIIGRMLPIADLGAINRPQGFVSRISTQINGIFDTVLFPILSSIKNETSRIERAYIKIVSLVFTLSLLLGSILSLGSKIVIEVFFGSQWIHLRPILIIFSLALIIHGYSRIADSFFRSLGIVKLYFMARLINWVIYITAVYIGCHFGIMGASIAMVIGSCISCIIKYLMQRREIGVSTSTLLIEILKNTAFIAIVFIMSLIVMFTLPSGDYLGLAVFLLVIAISMAFFPKVYGIIFREIVIDRYLKFAKKIRIY